MDTTIEIEKDFDRTEIINGEEVVSPSPFGKHQDIASKLHIAIGYYVQTKKLGKIFSSLDVIFEEGMYRFQPDILFIRNENMGIFQDWVRGVPDMVCEIVSSGSYDKDTVVKRAIYEKYRVPEYWIVIPELQVVEILTIEGDKYKQYCIAGLEGVVTSKVIDGLTITVKEIFE